MMTPLDSLPDIEFLGDGARFVPRLREIIDSIVLFEDFEAAEIERLAAYLRCYRVPAGTEVIHEGESGDFLLLVLDGAVEIVKKDAHGLPKVVATARPGKTLGEMSLIDGEPRFASCVALDPLEFAVLDREHLSLLIAEEPRIGVKLMMQLLMLLNQRLRGVSAQLMDCLEAKRARIR